MIETNDNNNIVPRSGRTLINLKVYLGTAEQLKESLLLYVKNNPLKEDNKIHIVYIYSTSDPNIWFYKHVHSLSDSVLDQLSKLDTKLYEKYEVKKNMKPNLRVV